MRRWWPRIAPHAVPAAVFLGVCLVMFWRLWTPLDGARRAFGWDALWEYWGDLQFFVDALRDGELPLWNPFDRTGYPYHADPQAGMLYPVTWLLAAFALVAGSTPHWLISVKIVLHFWLAGLGVYAFLRRRGTPRFACYAGGLMVMLSYPMLHNVFSALNWSFAWAPWMLLSIEAWAERPRLVRAALMAGAFGMGALAGGLASFWYGLLVAIPYGLWAIASAARAADDPRAYLRTAALTGAAALALFSCIVLAQLSATAGLTAESVRADRDVSFFGISVLHARDMLGFFLPRMQGENTYLGVAAILWAVAAVSLRPSGRALVLLGVFALGVACAWGERGMALPALASAVPPFSFFRRAHRYLYVSVLALAILSAEGLAALATLEGDALRRRLRRAVAAVGGVAAAVAAVAFALKLSDTPSHRSPVGEAFGLGAVAAVIATWVTVMLLTGDAARRRRFAAVAVVVLGLDLWFARAHVVDRNMHPLPRTTRDAQATELPGVPLEARIYDLEHLKYRPGLRRHIRDFGGYEDDPLSLSRYAGLLEDVRRHPRTLAHANVRYYLEEGRKALQKSPADRKVMKPRASRIWELSPIAPAVMWADTAIVADGGEGRARRELVRLEGGAAAVLEAPSLSEAQRARAADGDDNAAPIAGRLVELSRNRLVAEVDAPADGVVVVHEAFYPRGWEATVDGEPADIVPANALFRGVFVGPGAHRIEMRYRAPGFWALAVLELCALGAIAGILVVDVRRRRHRHA